MWVSLTHPLVGYSGLGYVTSEQSGLAPLRADLSAVPQLHLTVPVAYRLDYPGIGPEHSYLSEIGRAEYYAVTDDEALEAFQQVSRLEGIIPALETSHAFAYLKVTPALLLVSLLDPFHFLLNLEVLFA